MANRKVSRLNPTGVRLRRSFEQFALKHMIEKLNGSKEDVEAVCRLMHVYCELIRQDAAAGKEPRGSSRSNASQSKPGERSHDNAPGPRADEVAALLRTVRDLYGVDLEKTASHHDAKPGLDSDRE